MPKLTFRLLILFLATSASSNCYAQESQLPERKQLPYAKLLERVKGGDLTIDFKRLRFSYMDSPEYRTAKNTDEQAEAMIAAINANDFPAALKSAEVVLANDYVDLDAHFAEFVANRELHHDSEANFHKAVFEGLVRSITDSGDGKSDKTAYVVITTHEEYVLLRVMGLSPGQQSLKHSNHHSYDILEAKDPKTNQTVTLYFNVDVPFKHYQ
jgi:hypothetical protein